MAVEALPCPNKWHCSMQMQAVPLRALLQRPVTYSPAGADPAISLVNAACSACPVAHIILPDVPNLVPASPVVDLTPIHLISAVLLPSLT